jgi:hypothetical protein
MPPLTDAQLREYFAFIFGPDEPAVPEIIAAIVDASDDALEPFPLPVPPNPNPDETWSDVIDSPATKE